MRDVPPRFLVDAMLGRLARWLRASGLDAAFAPYREAPGPAGRRAHRAALRDAAASEGRVLLTRDARALEPAPPPPGGLLVRGDHLAEQLAAVRSAFPFDPLGAVLSRCLECNGVPEPAPRDDVRASVPPFTWRTHDRFLRCPGCRRVYWEGTHRARLLADLRRLHGLPPKEEGSGSSA